MEILLCKEILRCLPKKRIYTKMQGFFIRLTPLDLLDIMVKTLTNVL